MVTGDIEKIFMQAIQAYEKKSYAEALMLCNQILQEDSSHIKTLALCTLAYDESNNPAQALFYCDAVLAINPNNPATLSLKGNLLARLGQYENACAAFERSLQINPHDVKTLQNYALTLINVDGHKKALSILDNALAISPDNSHLLVNKAFILLELHRYQEALENYDQAFLINPHYAEAISDRGNALLGLKRYDEALASYSLALSVNPNCKLAHYSEGYCRLLIGDLLNGWPKYEYRWEVTQAASKRNFHQPLWLGQETIAGKKLLIHAEQGHGDAIQFSRYVPMLASLHADVYLEAYPDLKPLLESLVKPDHFIVRGQPLPNFDYHCPLLSLPLVFKTEMATIPHATPYLTSTRSLGIDDPLHLPPTDQPRIGIVWKANESNQRLQFRSIPLNQLLKIVMPDYLFVVLQKNVDAKEADLLANYPNIVDLHQHLSTFGDTAAIINQLDLIISVDTSVAHLAGAMNKPVWILLSDNANWRWFINRNDSPWYPSATLFRQNTFNKWNNVITDLKKSLKKFNRPLLFSNR